MNVPVPPSHNNGKAWSAPKERVFIQTLHWGVVLVVIIGVVALRMRGDLDNASTTALLGTVLGHAGTSATQKLSTRSTDHANNDG